jgi:hypothetical protein
MQTTLIAGAFIIAVLSLLLGCSETGTRTYSDNSKPHLQFERLQMTSVTTDHASTGGVSWVDYDGDGNLDLFVTNGYDVSAEAPTGQTNRLYHNDGNGSLVLVTSGALAISGGISSGSTWGDYDNDGDLDVFITNQQDQNNFLFRNEGNGTFVPIEDEPMATDGGHSYTAAWVDVNSDGWLDLFVANGGMSHSGKNGLYRGTGDGHFEKILEGDLVNDEAATCGIAWGDYDNDGDSDLFLANQGFASPANNNALYRNDGGWNFSRILNVAAVSDGLPSCAATWVDIDNDLDLDLHVTNMYGLADLLYINDGTGGLTRITGEPVMRVNPPVTLDGGHSYGANWEDYDNDGDVDLVVANWGAAPAVYLNDGWGSFYRADVGALGKRVEYVGAVASGDFDGDGSIDMYIGNWPNRPGPGELNCLYHNNGRNHWFRVRLAGTAGNRCGIGARVLLTFLQGEKLVTQMRDVTTQMGFRGQSDLSPHFGLGSADEVQSLEVRWPSGQVSRMTGIPADQIVTVTEPADKKSQRQ